MHPDDVPVTRKLLLYAVSGLVMLLLGIAARALGYLKDAGDNETTFAVLTAIWLAIHVVLYVVITGVGRHPD
jgi:hypothetical protein